MHPIPIPKELVNDEYYLVAVLLAAPRERVAKGQPIAELETSKTTFSIVSPADGFFHPDYAVDTMVPVGAIFGHIVEAEPNPAIQAEPADSPVPAADPRFSRAAWELFTASGLDIKSFTEMTHIRRTDVEQALSVRPQPPLDPSSLILLGGGGHCRECIEAIEQAGKYRIYGIIDSYAKPATIITGYPVLGDNSHLEQLRKEGLLHLVLAYAISGSQADRGAHFRRLVEFGHNFPNIIHPKAAVSAHATLGAGVQVMPGAVVGSEAVLGDACIVNSNAVVSHDCRLGENVHVAPGAVLAGRVTVGADTVIGMGATVFMRMKIGSGVVIYNGAHVFADVPDNTIVKTGWPLGK